MQRFLLHCSVCGCQSLKSAWSLKRKRNRPTRLSAKVCCAKQFSWRKINTFLEDVVFFLPCIMVRERPPYSKNYCKAVIDWSAWILWLQGLEATMAPPIFNTSSEPLNLSGGSGSSHGASSSGDSSSSAPSSSSTSPVTSDLEHQQGEIFQRINELLQDPCADDNLSSPDHHSTYIQFSNALILARCMHAMWARRRLLPLAHAFSALLPFFRQFTHTRPDATWRANS